jgi:hypothetical protein
VHRQLGRLLVFAHQRQAAIGGQQHLIGAGLAVAPAVLALAVDIEIMVGMLDDRDAEPAARISVISASTRLVLPAPE